MHADAAPLLSIFEKKARLEVPIFQRQYVWNQEKHWEPLWEDISRKFIEYLEGRKTGPVHFLGAMVLDQKQTPTTHVEKRQVIDGQQRLTTLQIFLAALRDFCRQRNCVDLADECENFTLNKGMMVDPETEKFKVFPTQLDRPQFRDVVTSGSKAALELKHPMVWKKYARKPDPRPQMVEAYLYFYAQIEEFFLGSVEEPPVASETPLATRLDECFQALKNALQVVVIDLGEGDDAQVIFETLNARGEPLLPADLLRNFIFLRAGRQGEPQEELYQTYWAKFDDPFWREEIRQGRLSRPRSDLFLQYFLTSRKFVDIPIKHLFVEYKSWITGDRPFASVRDELNSLAKQGDDFRRLLSPKEDDVIYSFGKFLECFDISTVYPLLLLVLDSKLDSTELRKAVKILESYMVRRAVCDFSTKNYNRTFLAIAKALKRDGVSAANLTKQLSALSGESSVWPNNNAFLTAWSTTPAYHYLSNPRIVYILKQIDDTYLTNKNESINVQSPLSIEHLLPQDWLENWPMNDGSRGLSFDELVTANNDDSKAVATRRRNSLIHTFGNLTMLSQPLNSSVSNDKWSVKKPEILRSSLLPINQQLYSIESWNEAEIERRGKELFERAAKIWAYPETK